MRIFFGSVVIGYGVGGARRRRRRIGERNDLVVGFPLSGYGPSLPVDNDGVSLRLAAMEMLVLFEMDYLRSVLDRFIFSVAVDFPIKRKAGSHVGEPIQCIGRGWIGGFIPVFVDMDPCLV